MRTMALAIANLVLLSGTVSAAVLVGSHVGDTDPTTEGWTPDLAGPGTSAGPTNDAGIPVWSIADSSSALESARWYRQPLTPADLATALTSGWRVRAELRVENAAGQGETQFFGFVTGSVAFQVHLRAEANGDATARVVEGYPPFTGPTFVVPGGASSNHRYELVSDGASGTAAFVIDGVEIHSGYDGLPFGSAN
jgi:hypothetical protein